jgi:hypothetical protein
MNASIHAEVGNPEMALGKLWWIANDHWEATRWKKEFTNKGAANVELIPAYDGTGAVDVVITVDRGTASEVLGRPVVETDWLTD